MNQWRDDDYDEQLAGPRVLVLAVVFVLACFIGAATWLLW